MIHIFAAILAIIILAPGISYGQDYKIPSADDSNYENLAAEIFEQLPEEIKEQITDEMQELYERCTKDKMSAKYKDCKCVAMKYIDIRVMEPPEKKKDEIAHMAIAQSAECINDAEIAGYHYPICLQNFIDIVINAEGYCTCYANSMAKNYLKYGDNPRVSLLALNEIVGEECAMNRYGFR
jgi:hypothetical protein